MKNIITTLLAGLTLTFTAYAQESSAIGNKDISNLDTEVNSNSNYLVGIKIHNDTQSEINTIGLVGNNTKSGVQLSLYRDNNGKPGQLIVASEKGYVGDGETALAIKPTQIEAGDYWIMAIYEETGHHVYSQQYADGQEVYYTNLAYGSDIPNDASTFENYTGHEFAYYIENAVEDSISKSTINVYQNSSTDTIRILNSKENYEVKIYDFSGTLVRSLNVTSKETELNISGLNPGMYVVSFDGKIAKKIAIN
ncbi:T9SS type A sorting domain-containing protein [Flavivirga rizhaonensis]|uniref:T9SS type A sorting domain-containing protein n=1 Tax=Flavivirga rizhaonensis TaxID=2559571 RepID=A0A4S1DZM3_9FLAO|nr:T9SS type A sorting domain-containing protein [Flavivirga rizhaonensis]TGV03811.1 T9SS type A sorting domain-containing protein [Flavivirga rizhaonensis]